MSINTQDKSITLNDLKPLKKEYEKAVEKGESVFEYKGVPILTDYAKYLIQHLTNLSKSRK